MATSRRLANTFQATTPIGKGLQAVSQALFSGNGRNPELDAAHMALYDAQTREHGAKADIEAGKREGFRRMSDIFSRYPGALATQQRGLDVQGPANIGPDLDPVSQARTNYDNAGEFLRTAPADAMSAAVLAGHDPKNVSEAFRGMLALTPGVDDATVVRSVIGAGGNMHGVGGESAVSLQGIKDASSRHEAAQKDRAVTTTGMTVAEQRRHHMATEGETNRYNSAKLALDKQAGPLSNVLLPNGDQAITRDGKTDINGNLLPAGSVLATRRGEGANPTPRNYVTPDGYRGITYDGVTDASSGKQLPEQTQIRQTTEQGPIPQSGIEKARVAELNRANLRATLGRARELAADERNFGLVGDLRRTAQDAFQQGSAFMKTIGVSADNIQQEIANAKNGIGISEFDPNLPAMDVIRNVLAYQYASAVAGQQGRDVSNKDYEAAKKTVGESGLLANRAAFLARANEIERQIDMMDEQSRKSIKGAGGKSGAPVSSALTPPPGASAPSGSTGVPTINSQEEYDALPPGTSYFDSQGNQAVKR